MTDFDLNAARATIDAHQLCSCLSLQVYAYALANDLNAVIDLNHEAAAERDALQKTINLLRNLHQHHTAAGQITAAAAARIRAADNTQHAPTADPAIDYRVLAGHLADELEDTHTALAELVERLDHNHLHSAPHGRAPHRPAPGHNFDPGCYPCAVLNVLPAVLLDSVRVHNTQTAHRPQGDRT